MHAFINYQDKDSVYNSCNCYSMLINNINSSLVHAHYYENSLASCIVL